MSIEGYTAEKYLKNFTSKFNPPTARKIKNSAVLIAEHDLSSEWLLQMMDHHPNICAGGSSPSGRPGYPTGILAPWDKETKSVSTKVSQMRSSCHWAMFQKWVPKVQQQPEICHGDKTGNPLGKTLGRHLPNICKFIAKYPNATSEDRIFEVYFSKLLRNENTFWFCSCPRLSTTMVVKMKSSWIGR
ncbi:hypothetical protein AAMO2058_001542500 [Amorphochlora amoebiformis]